MIEKVFGKLLLEPIARIVTFAMLSVITTSAAYVASLFEEGLTAQQEIMQEVQKFNEQLTTSLSQDTLDECGLYSESRFVSLER